MKTLVLQRHAQSSLAHAGLNDHERTLDEQGKLDASLMVRFFSNLSIKPGLIVSSTAIRAVMTAETYLKEQSFPPEKYRKEELLYHFDGHTYPDVIGSLADDVDTALLIGHNPSIALLCDYIMGAHVSTVRISTASMHCFELAIDFWSEFKRDCGRLLWSVHPKLIRVGFRA